MLGRKQRINERDVTSKALEKGSEDARPAIMPPVDLRRPDKIFPVGRLNNV